MRATTQTTTEPAAGDLPDGVNSEAALLTLARMAAGFEGDHLPGVVIFDETYFSEITAFIKTSSGNGYYKTTLKSCTCPSFRYRGGPCKHQKLLTARLERKARIDERNAKIREERTRSPRQPSASKGFNMPEGAEA